MFAKAAAMPPVVINTGMMTEDPEVLEVQQWEPEVLPERKAELDWRHPSEEWKGGRLVVFVDGSCMHANDDRFRRAGA